MFLKIIATTCFIFNIFIDLSYHTDGRVGSSQQKCEVQFVHKFWLEVTSRNIALWQAPIRVLCHVTDPNF